MGTYLVVTASCMYETVATPGGLASLSEPSHLENLNQKWKRLNLFWIGPVS